uniref:Uncharacterized protein n=1 Tax=Timema monikensis TaxID=170555 RepID=A0A7R9HTP4_9NEOP|nr:unnamed protein product [Timema monikensis]
MDKMLLCLLWSNIQLYMTSLDRIIKIYPRKTMLGDPLQKL